VLAEPAQVPCGPVAPCGWGAGPSPGMRRSPGQAISLVAGGAMVRPIEGYCGQTGLQGGAKACLSHGPGWRPALLEHCWGRGWWRREAGMGPWAMGRVGGPLGALGKVSKACQGPDKTCTSF